MRAPFETMAARPHSEGEQVWLGLDPSARRHILVRAPGEEVGQHFVTTHGLTATTERLAIEGEPPDVWIDVVCLEPALEDTFAALADDVAEASTREAANPVDALKQTLTEWRWFWAVDAAGLSSEAALGLFGELWFLDRWVAIHEGITAWVGPTGSRHDFVSATVSVEVKATRARFDGPVRHRITSLEQLEVPEQGELFLFSLTVSPDANASNSLPNLVSHVRERVRDRPDLLGLLDQRLAEVGWTPAVAERHADRLRVTAEELYRVSDEFPRLTSNSFAGGLPVGIDQVAYVLDLAACEPFRVATSPDGGAPLLGILGA